jgi:hypothetical protein
MREMLRTAVSLVCSVTALIGIGLMDIPMPTAVLFVAVVLSFVIFSIATGFGKKVDRRQSKPRK